jgi:predicted nucleic acid-binding protein
VIIIDLRSMRLDAEIVTDKGVGEEGIREAYSIVNLAQLLDIPYLLLTRR